MSETKLDEKVLRMFVDRLIADKGGDKLDEKQKETLRGEMLEELDARMESAMIRALPDAKLMELEGMLDAEAPDEEIERFFENAGVDFDPVLRGVMDDFRADYLRGKVKVSVEVEASAAGASAVGASAGMGAPAGASDATPVVSATGVSTTPVAAPLVATTSVAQPAQGTTSAVPGQSNVEGVANAASAAAQGQVPAGQTQVVAQGAAGQATPVQTVPVQPVQVQAAPTNVDMTNNANNGLTGKEA